MMAMTEKRFECEEDSDYIQDNKTGERALYLCDWLNKLNSLSEELYIAENEIARLELINDKLKKENEMLKITIGRNEAYINQLTNKEKWTN